MDVRFQAARFLRRLPWFLLVLFLGTAVGLALAALLPPVYQTQARLLVEAEQIPGELAQSTVQTESTEQLQIVQQRILARDSLLALAERMEIYADDPRQAEGSLRPEVIVGDLRERITIVTTGGAAPRRPVQATLVTLGFRAPTAEMAAAVTNELVAMVQREDVAMRRNVARQTLDFFEQEVDRLDAELAERAAAILAFQEGNQDALPDSLEFRRAQQAASQERLLQLEREEAALRDRRARLQDRQAGTTPAASELPPPSEQTPEQRQLRDLRSELATQRVVLSEAHPRIRILRARIAALEALIDGQPLPEATASGAPVSTTALQLEEIEGQLLFLADQKAQVRATLDGLRVSIEATPGNTITLQTLQRDYDNTRIQYDQAVANRARAETGEEIETLSKGRRISVVEEAVVPTAPRGPKRSLIAAGGMGVGAVLGLGLVILLDVLQKGIRRPADLSAALGIQPLATLPYYRTEAEIRHRRTAIAASFALTLLGVPMALWGIHEGVMPLDDLIRALGRGFGLT